MNTQTTTHDESLSVLMDGELGGEPARFLLRRLQHDDAALRRWASYHLAQSVLRRELPARLAGSDFAAQVAARIRVQPLPAAAGGPRWLRWSVRGMAAAAVAAAALMLVPQQQIFEPDAVGTAAPAPAWLSARPAGSAADLHAVDFTLVNHHDTLPLIDPLAAMQSPPFGQDAGVMPYLLGDQHGSPFRPVEAADR